MSRYSRIFLRPPKGTTLSSESWGGSSSAEPHSTASPEFSYPPSSSLPSRDADSPMTSPPPHPYTLGALHSPIGTTFNEPSQRQLGHTQQNTSEFSAEKPQEQGIGFQYPQPQHVRPRSLARSQSVILPPITISPLFAFLLFLPVPPLLAMIYIVTGHAMLRASKSSPNSIYLSPIVASLEAGATGGVILSLPLALLLYLLVYPSKPRDSPEDFFEDDNSAEMQEKWLRYTGYAVAAFFLLAIGGIAGPLGVACLSSGSLDEFVGDKRLLSTSAAAAAGFVGGVTLVFATLTIGVLSAICWTRFKTTSS